MKSKEEAEASLKSGITPDLKRIKKYDEIIAKSNMSRKRLLKFIIIFLASTTASYFLNSNVMIVLAVITVLLIVMLCMQRSISKEKYFFSIWKAKSVL